MRWLAGRPGAWSLTVHVQPGASRSGCAGEHDGCLKVRVAAPPVDGRANDALCAFLARRLGVPRSAVHVDRGATGRRKRVHVELDVPAAEIVSRLSP